jgi:hypothetical protein
MAFRQRTLEDWVFGLFIFLTVWVMTSLLVWLACVLTPDGLVSWSFVQCVQASFIGITIVRAALIIES